MSHQECRVDNLWVGMVQEEDEAWQTALIFYDGPSVERVRSKVAELVDHSQRIHLCTHGATRLEATHIKPTSSLFGKMQDNTVCG